LFVVGETLRAHAHGRALTASNAGRDEPAAASLDAAAAATAATASRVSKAVLTQSMAT
jgi:hypothetical protein